MVTDSVDALLARGEAQLAKDRTAFMDTARRIDPSKDPAAVIKQLTDDHPTAEDLLVFYVASALASAWSPKISSPSRRRFALASGNAPMHVREVSPRWTRRDRTRRATERFTT
jgi:uncharacterized glyoxalase superfamily metalloenzyme YdcJ